MTGPIDKTEMQLWHKPRLFIKVKLKETKPWEINEDSKNMDLILLTKIESFFFISFIAILLHDRYSRAARSPPLILTTCGPVAKFRAKSFKKVLFLEYPIIPANIGCFNQDYTLNTHACIYSQKHLEKTWQLKKKCRPLR